MFQEILSGDLQMNVFNTIGKDWMLITAQKGDKINTMTASWGGMGIMWGKPVAYIFIRPQRCTKEFVDSADCLSLSVLPGEFRKQLNYFGTVSGRDEDKIALSGLQTQLYHSVPLFTDAKAAFICRKLYAQELKEDCFIDSEAPAKWYPQKDYHTMYVVELEHILIRDGN